VKLENTENFADMICEWKCIKSPIRADILMKMFEQQKSKCCGTLNFLDDDGNWKCIGEISGIHLDEVWVDEYNEGAKE
jgi:hypothetical protein